MTALRVRFAAIQARVEGILDGMSPRDRSLLLGLVAFFSIVLVLGGAWTMNGSWRPWKRPGTPASRT